MPQRPRHRYQTGFVRLQTESLTWATSLRAQPAAVGAHAAPVRPVGPGSSGIEAQHDAAQAYIRSQAHAGRILIRARYDDGGYSGGSTDRPALQRLLSDVKAGKIDVIVVYKVDRLTRSLADFAKLVELFDGSCLGHVRVQPRR
jgi:hypothetical protein